MGFVSVSARIGGMLAPFILMLGDIVPNLQFTALGILTFLSGLLNLKLPETLGQPMTETVADILALRKQNVSEHSTYLLVPLWYLSASSHIQFSTEAM